MKHQENPILDDIQNLQRKLTKFHIGDEVCITGGLGDYDEGIVTGVSIEVLYEVQTEYGYTVYMDADRITHCKHEEKE